MFIDNSHKAIPTGSPGPRGRVDRTSSLPNLLARLLRGAGFHPLTASLIRRIGFTLRRALVLLLFRFLRCVILVADGAGFGRGRWMAGRRPAVLRGHGNSLSAPA